MKAGIFVAAASLVQIAAAQPHRHGHAAVHDLEKRQVYVTDVSYATVTAAGPDVVVYVNAAGEPVSTSTVGETVATTPTSAPTTSATPTTTTEEHHHKKHSTTSSTSTPATSSSTYIAPVVAFSSTSTTVAPIPTVATSTTEAAAESYTEAATTTAAVASSTPSTSSESSSSSESSTSSTSSSSGDISGTGIVYSPYAANGACKTQDDVDTDFAQLGAKGYGFVRLYGTDCEQMTTVGNAVQKYGMTIFAGIYSIDDVASEAQIIIDAANGDFSWINTVSVGNELVNSGSASAAEVVAAVGQARSILTAAGYTGKIVTVDTVSAVLENLSLCEASDFAAVNAHPFFDATLLPGLTGAWAVATKLSVAVACGKEAMITETGMPWGGDCNGSMCPSYANQATVLSQLSGSLGSNYIILSAYNDLWKQNTEWTFGAEQDWGIYGDCPSA